MRARHFPIGQLSWNSRSCSRTASTPRSGRRTCCAFRPRTRSVLRHRDRVDGPVVAPHSPDTASEHISLPVCPLPPPGVQRWHSTTFQTSSRKPVPIWIGALSLCWSPRPSFITSARPSFCFRARSTYGRGVAARVYADAWPYAAKTAFLVVGVGRTTAPQQDGRQRWPAQAFARAYKPACTDQRGTCAGARAHVCRAAGHMQRRPGAYSASTRAVEVQVGALSRTARA